jgi:hypothetical protein
MVTRREMLKKLGLAPLALLISGVDIAQILNEISKRPEIDWRTEIKKRYTGRIVTSDLLIDLIDDVLRERGVRR